MSESGMQDWREAVYEELVAARVSQVAYVPDAGHSHVITRCHEDSAITPVVLTTEEEGIGVLAGADLAGSRGVLLMQSSGVGNCLNTFSLVRNCGFPIVTIVTMRGEWGEFNPWQVPMGQATAATLEMGGLVVQRVDDPGDVRAVVKHALHMAFEGGTAMAVLLSQRLIGAKTF